MAGLGKPLEEVEIPDPAEVPDRAPAREPEPATPRR